MQKSYLLDERPSWTETYFAIAEVIAKRSKDPHTKVGAVLVKEGCVISVAYNGEPKNSTLEFDWHSSEKYSHVVHAEMNAIANASRMGISTVNTDMYLTLSPCCNCMNMLIQHGVKRVFFKQKYSDYELSKKIAKNSEVVLTQVDNL